MKPAIREHQVLALYAAGEPYAAIGARLGIAESTVNEYVRRLRKRYGVTGRAALVNIAVGQASRNTEDADRG